MDTLQYTYRFKEENITYYRNQLEVPLLRNLRAALQPLLKLSQSPICECLPSGNHILLVCLQQQNCH